MYSEPPGQSWYCVVVWLEVAVVVVVGVVVVVAVVVCVVVVVGCSVCAFGVGEGVENVLGGGGKDRRIE